MIIIMLLATIIWAILCGSIFLMGCFILGHTIFNLVHSTLCIGEVCNIKISGGTKASAVKFQLIAKYKGKMIKVEPLTTLTILPFWENAQLKRFQKKYLGKQMKVYINVNGSSYLKQFLPRLFLMGIFCIILSVYAFIIPYI